MPADQRGPKRTRLQQLASSGDSLGGTETEPSSQVEHLLRDLAGLFRAVGICAYMLDTGARAFQLITTVGDFSPFSSVIKVSDDGKLIVRGEDQRSDVLRTAHMSQRPARLERMLVVPVLRGTGVVALVEILLPNDRWLSDSTIDELRSALLSLSWIHAEQSVEKLFRGMKEPLDFRLPRDEFLKRMGRLVLASCSVQRAALREIQGPNLVCVAFWGSDVESLSDVSFPIDLHEPFHLACEGQTVFEIDLRRSGLESLAAMPALRDVRSFVAAPVHVAGDMFGVLSVALTYTYEIPPLVQLGIEALANGIGISLVNYRAHHGSGLALENLSNISASMTAAEVAQAARHEALDLIHGATANVAEVEDVVEQLPGRLRGDFAEPLADLSENLINAAIAIDKIRLATRPPSFDHKDSAALSEVWSDVVDQLKGRLDDLGIAVRYVAASGPRPTVEIYRDWFRHVFLHLMLNSIDAFRGIGYGTSSPTKRNREISLAVDAIGGQSRTLVMRYSDNAGGINPTRLMGPEQFADIPFEQRIFSANVTSKGSQGSGYGLYLVRRILDLHDGSIDLERSRGGVTFKIQMPLPAGTR